MLVLVIDPAVRPLAPPKTEVTSTVEGIRTYWVPFQPAIVSLLRSLVVKLPIALDVLQARVIAVALAPSMSQYSSVRTHGRQISRFSEGRKWTARRQDGVVAPSRIRADRRGGIDKEIRAHGAIGGSGTGTVVALIPRRENKRACTQPADVAIDMAGIAGTDMAGGRCRKVEHAEGRIPYRADYAGLATPTTGKEIVIAKEGHLSPIENGRVALRAFLDPGG